MGGSSSRSSPREGSGHHSRAFPQQPQYYGHDAQSGYYGAPPQGGGGGYAVPYPAYQAPPPMQPTGAVKPQLDRRYSRIADDYHSVDQVRFAICI